MATQYAGLSTTRFMLGVSTQETGQVVDLLRKAMQEADICCSCTTLVTPAVINRLSDVIDGLDSPAYPPSGPVGLTSVLFGAQRTCYDPRKRARQLLGELRRNARN